MLITEYKKKKIFKNELPVYCMSPEVQDEFYSIKVEDDSFYQQNNSSTLILNNEVVLGNISLEDLQQNLSEKVDKRLKKRKKYTQTKQFKVKKIYFSPDFYKNELYKLKNGDIAYKKYDLDGNLINDNEKPKINQVFENEQELSKWKDKPYKNLHGANVYEVRPKLYKGNNGLIDPSLPYNSSWYYVYADNTFKYNDAVYKLDSSLSQYQGKEVKISRKGDTELRYDMDNILVLEQNGQKFFFDMNIDRVSEEFVKLVTFKCP
jgi:hypothetical protein